MTLYLGFCLYYSCSDCGDSALAAVAAVAHILRHPGIIILAIKPVITKHSLIAFKPIFYFMFGKGENE